MHKPSWASIELSHLIPKATRLPRTLCPRGLLRRDQPCPSPATCFVLTLRPRLRLAVSEEQNEGTKEEEGEEAGGRGSRRKGQRRGQVILMTLELTLVLLG